MMNGGEAGLKAQSSKVPDPLGSRRGGRQGMVRFQKKREREIV